VAPSTHYPPPRPPLRARDASVAARSHNLDSTAWSVGALGDAITRGDRREFVPPNKG